MNKTKFAEVQATKLSWPSPQDYNEALQYPAISFACPELKIGKPQLNSLGLPKPITGAFASVYYMDCPERDYAVRCFLHNISDQKERYAKISECLNRLNLPIMADFDYLEKGVLTQSNWFPILRMDWVDGQNLIQFIGRNLDNAKVLEKLRQWIRQACKTLKEYGIAHGDLQHGNILVTNDQVKLVDYDGMFVPELKGWQSNELGHRNYQHPGRTKKDFGPHLDNFSAWLIDTSLYCLERDPTLWFTLRGGEDCLLFREKDLQDPYSSYAFHELEEHKNGEIRERVRWLRYLLSLPVNQIPDINNEVELTVELPQLDAEKKKPDWLSSARYLSADEVEPYIYAQKLPDEAQGSRPAAKPYVASWWRNHAANPANQYGASQPNVLTIPNNWPGLPRHPIRDFFLTVLVSVMLVAAGAGYSYLQGSYRPSTAPVPVHQELQVREYVQRLFDKGTKYYNLKNYKSALQQYQLTLAALKDTGQDGTIEVANCNYWIGRVQMQLGRYSDAFKSLKTAEKIYGKYALTPDIAKVYHGYGIIYSRQHKFANAISMFEKSLKKFEQLPASQFIEDCKADTSYNLALAHAGIGQHNQAVNLFRRVVNYYDNVETKQHGSVVKQLVDIAGYFQKHSTRADVKQALRVANHVATVNGSPTQRGLVERTARAYGVSGY